MSKGKPVRRRVENSGHIYELATKDKHHVMKGQNKLSFFSLTLRKINPKTVATVFVVRTHKPIRWVDFIKAVTDALEDKL